MVLKTVLKHSSFKWFLAAIIFAATFFSRSCFVDTYYQYSFESDSEACVSVSKSFYNFFKNPCEETIPHKLTDYPPYQSGDFVFAGLTGNLLRPLVKAGIIQADIGDGDNSIVIYAMRWNSAVFQSVVAVLVFLITSLIFANYLFSFLLVLLYYILSPQILDFDLARIDHYYFFAAALVIYFTIKLFRSPEQVWNYIFLGASVAMVMATKLNFPFYLMIVLFTMIYLITTKKIGLRNFIIAFGSFAVMWVFLFQRWIFYPEEIMPTIEGILQTGDDWVTFWGIQPYLYYHLHQFFSEGFSWEVVVLLFGWLLSFIVTVWYAIKQKDAFTKMLLITFLVQSLMLMIVPKVGRYGTVIPIWLCIFFAYTAHYLSTNYKPLYSYLLLLFVLPNAFYAYSHFANHSKQWIKVKSSIESTRFPAVEWIEANAAPGSVVAVYHPRISNPPILEMPINISEKYLYYPFLYSEKAAHFEPVSFGKLEDEANYVVINNQYYNYHFWLLDNLIDNKIENAQETKLKWQIFYDALDLKYEHVEFKAGHENYGIEWYKIYIIDSVPKNIPFKIGVYSIKKIKDNGVRMTISSEGSVKSGQLELQISTDSTFRWVNYASLDGFESKYRESMIARPNFIPTKIDSLLNKSLLKQLGVANRVDRLSVNSVFMKIIHSFEEGAENLGYCLDDFMKEDYKPKFYQLLGNAYGFKTDYPSLDYNQFKQMLGYRTDVGEKLHSASVIVPEKLLDKNGMNYFRVRAKQNHVVLSSWVYGEIDY